ncbi:uncharacterized protein LOC131029340 isoform X2 [Cryptomeria japonica]|uniref:uncharacterized protein LOC131029340 isoform X2 n=1 Tax=Cryptomeria japonica TaxID=3369 RepID=UPI0027DA19F1|nr:uncharacterized protein LOC131029340 isoform X2 [Cryptomeria japonica]
MEKSDGRQSQLEEADHDKPLEKPLIKRDVFIPFMVILITDMAIFVCSGFHYLLTAMKAEGLFFNIIFVGTIVVYFTVAIVLVITKAQRTGRTILFVYLNSAVFSYLSSLAAQYTVMSSWLFTSLCFFTVVLTAFHWFVLFC